MLEWHFDLITGKKNLSWPQINTITITHCNWYCSKSNWMCETAVRGIKLAGTLLHLCTYYLCPTLPRIQTVCTGTAELWIKEKNWQRLEWYTYIQSRNMTSHSHVLGTMPLLKGMVLTYFSFFFLEAYVSQSYPNHLTPMKEKIMLLKCWVQMEWRQVEDTNSVLNFRCCAQSTG